MNEPSPKGWPGTASPELMESNESGSFFFVNERNDSLGIDSEGVQMANHPSTTVPATVEQIIKPKPFSDEPEKAQISVKGADHYYREIRIENTLTDPRGRKYGLKEGTEIQVTVEADSDDTTPKT